MASQALDGGALEEVGIVFQAAGEAPARVVHRQHQLEHRRPLLAADRQQSHARQLEAPGRQVLHLEHDLKQGVDGQVPLRLQLLDQPLEGEVLVGVGIEGHGAHSRQQREEIGISRQVRTQHQRVGEETDQPLELDPLAVGDRRAHGDVRLAGVAVEQGRETGEQGHERRRLAAAAEIAQRLAEGLR